MKTYGEGPAAVQALRGVDLENRPGRSAFVLLGELAVIALVALPVGALLGYFLSFAIAAGFSSDLYQVPAIFSPESYGIAAVAVLLAAIASGWLVKYDMDRAELVSALKTRE